MESCGALSVLASQRPSVPASQRPSVPASQRSLQNESVVFDQNMSESSQIDGRLLKRKYTLRPRNDIAGPWRHVEPMWSPCGAMWSPTHSARAPWGSQRSAMKRQVAIPDNKLRFRCFTLCLLQWLSSVANAGCTCRRHQHAEAPALSWRIERRSPNVTSGSGSAVANAVTLRAIALAVLAGIVGAPITPKGAACCENTVSRCASWTT